VGFSMIASYLLASSFVPVVCVWMMRARRAEETDAATTPRGGFERFRAGYGRLAERALPWRWLIVTGYLAVATIVVLAVGSRLGSEIFPKVEAGQLQLRLRAQPGTRVDRTEALALRALEIVKQETGPDGVALTLAFVGVHAPSYPINFVYQWNGGPEEGVLQVQLKAKGALDELKERLRGRFAREMPDVVFSFEPSDIVSRVMSFGSATPIEVAVSGPSLATDAEFAERVRQQLEKIPVLRDVHLGQSLDYPTLNVAVDRERAGLLGIRTVDVARSLVAATSSSRFTQPVYWADPGSGVAYQVQVQVPQQQMGSPEDVGNIPVGLRGGQSVLLRNLATVTPGTAVGQYERYNMQRLVTVTANIQGTDLGHAASLVGSAVRALGEPPPRVTVALRGQLVPMQQMMDGLRNGLALAVVAILLLLVANFQSVRLSLVVGSALPAVVAGVAVALWVTRTTLNIQSFMGAIMAIGVAVANAILLVTFAERSRIAGAPAAQAAVEGARSRLRPILMTSLAMMAGMVPIALGLGEGGEQTAPLGRAVIGGLAAATVATLLVLPSVFAIIQGRTTRRSRSLDPDDPLSAHYVSP
jgi:multidrug efflux pump subunit AcrB